MGKSIMDQLAELQKAIQQFAPYLDEQRKLETRLAKIIDQLEGNYRKALDATGQSEAWLNDQGILKPQSILYRLARRSSEDDRTKPQHDEPRQDDAVPEARGDGGENAMPDAPIAPAETGQDGWQQQ